MGGHGKLRETVIEVLFDEVFLEEDMFVVTGASFFVDVRESQVQIFFLDSKESIDPLLSDE